MRSRWQGFLQVPQYSLTFTWNVLFKQIMMLGQLVLYSRDNWNAIIQCSMRIIVTALWIGPYIFIYIKCYHSCMLWIITKSLIVITLLPRVQIFHKNKKLSHHMFFSISRQDTISISCAELPVAPNGAFYFRKMGAC